jgi:phosphoserine aminotransferase
VFNFSAGPAVLPVEVLEKCRDDILNYDGCGMSVMEMSHRSAPFEGILARAEADLRALLAVPAGYKILFLQGGASLQFSMIPMCFHAARRTADYVVTGAWSEKAVEEATIVGPVNIAFDDKENGYRCIPDFNTLALSTSAAYVHLTSNETIQGVEFPEDPATDAPLIVDMSSNILSRPIDVSRYGLIYAGAQKNMGPAGLVVVIIREDLLERVPAKIAPMLDYRLQAKNGSLYNTPPAWSIYVTGLVYRHLLELGGLEAARQLREKRSSILYSAIDGSGGFYRGHADKLSRSCMNVTFTLPTAEATKQFLSGAEKEGFSGLPGHRSVGGCRASIYNAFPVEGCEALASYMSHFAAANG